MDRHLPLPLQPTMHFASFVAALGVLSPLASAALDADFEADHFSIDQVDIGRTYLKSAIHDIRDALVKHNGSAPKEIEEAVARKNKGSVAAKPESFDREFLVPVKLGTPAKIVHLVLDTGSSDLWTFSSAQPAAQRKGHSFYTPSKSKSAKRLRGATWNIKYGDGSSAGGVVYKDTVKLGGLTVHGQAVEAASHAARQFVLSRSEDGIIGFGFSNINTVKPQKQKTWFANAAPHLNRAVLGANLHYHNPGSYDIGYLNAAKYKGPIHYTPVDRRAGVFLFRAGGFAVGGGAKGPSFRAIADTGTSVILVSNNIVRAYYSKIRKAAFDREFQEYVFPCSETPPDFHIFVGGSKRTIPGKFLRYAPDRTVSGTKYCVGGIQSNNGLGVAVLGLVFLKSQYVVFDYGNNRLGFADK